MSRNTLDRLLELGFDHQQAGRPRQAETIYRAILAIQSDHAGAKRALDGLIESPWTPEMVPPEEQQQLLALIRAGRLHEAVTASQRLVQHYPQDAFSWKAYGSLMAKLEPGETAVAALETAQTLNPQDPEIHNNLGRTLHDLGRFEAALTQYRQALEIQPDLAEAHNNMGITLNDLGRFVEAEACYRQAIARNPNYVSAHSNLGAVLHALGRVSEADAACHQAIRLDPGFAQAHNNLGNILRRLGRLSEAEISYRRALELKPESAEMLTNMGAILNDLCRLSEAEACFRQALRLHPKGPAAYSNLLFTLGYTGHASPQAQRSEAEGWERAVLSEEERTQARARVFSLEPRSGRRLRLGVLSAELGRHAVAYFLRPWLHALDRSRFSVHLYPTRMRTEAEVAAFQALADGWTPLVGLSDAEAAARIRADRIDVLVDTSGHTERNRLGVIAHRAAPVQCHYIGYFGTSGLSEMDYVLADATLIPPALEGHFTERVWRLPRPWLAYAPLEEAPEPNWRPDPEGTLWLGSFNNLTKVRDDCLALWAEVLRALPESRLLLKDERAEDRATQQRIRDTLARSGIEAARVVFAGRQASWREHMAQYDRIDIALDPIPLNSGTTAFDALWMGVPLVSLAGDWMGGRMGAAILAGIGREEWIAGDREAYVASVVALAQDIEARRAIRATQRERMRRSPLCDGVDLARALETAFEQMVDERLKYATARSRFCESDQVKIDSNSCSRRELLLSDECKIVYRTENHNSRNTLMLLHGALCQSSSLQHLSAACVDRCNVIIPDLRGHGESTLGNQPWTLERLAKDMIAVADANGANSLILIGESFGALVAAKIASLIPERVRLVICSEPPLSPWRLPDVEHAILRACQNSSSQAAHGLATILGYNCKSKKADRSVEFHSLIKSLEVQTVLLYGTTGRGATATVINKQDLNLLRHAKKLHKECIAGADHLVLRTHGLPIIEKWLSKITNSLDPSIHEETA